MSVVVKALTLDWFAANVQRGSANFVAVGLVNVTFPIAFAQVPKVTATVGIYTTKTYAVITKTTTGFTITFNGTFTGPVDWIAVVA